MGTLLSFSGGGASGRHHSRTEDALRKILSVIVHSLLVVLHNVVLAFVLVTTLENVTSLEDGHGRATTAKVSLLLSLVLNLVVERAGHVGMILSLLTGVVNSCLTAKRVKGLIE